jgi:hypothetical protein
MRATGAELKIGDTIEVWWKPRRDTIISLRPYTGRLAYLWETGAQIASFAICTGGMTVGNDEIFEVVARGGTS